MLCSKGGTAINLFIRNMPRLSVDIDLTYVPVQPRPQSLAAIDAAFGRIIDRIKKGVPGAQIAEARTEGARTRLLVRVDGVQIKIEVTPVLRGCVYQPESRSVAEAVEEAFGFAEMSVVSFADLYAGKLVAALDRQHPRDFFDVRDLLASEGIDDALRRAFVVYLVSHDRPMHEVLRPRRKDISEEFLRGFNGMTVNPITIEQLVAARERLIADIVGKMPSAHRKFLVSFEHGAPNWALLGLPAAAELPAVKWRQLNLDTLTPEKRTALVGELQKALAQ
jgi:predicted nucleotidyltransferase component of viral defense system